jgi:transcriptional regulator of heat shock response
LEEMGLLVQPHTSAGRIPSDKLTGFVGRIMGDFQLTDEEVEEARVISPTWWTRWAL